MAKIHLTDVAVKALKPTDRYVTYWDTMPGFGIRVGKQSKTWTVMRGRSRERISIGRYPDISLSDARAEAKRLLSTAPEPKNSTMRFDEARTIFLEQLQGFKIQSQVPCHASPQKSFQGTRTQTACRDHRRGGPQGS
ncbi:MAG: DUF4102 domain-containing protein [Sphingomonadales bacterium]|nr:DUF4102 domain-containing protein [Sphingomonadales bacterium]